MLPCLERPLWQDTKDFGAIAFAVNYRVAPEHKYPAALDDNYTAFKSISKHRNEFGGDIKKIVMEGNSAGSNLITVITQKSKKESLSHKIELQITNAIWLIYKSLIRKV